MSDSTVCDLSMVALFAALSPAARGEVEQRCRMRGFTRGQVVVHHRDDSSELFFVLNGSVRVVIHSLSGKDVVFRDLGAGEVFGELAAIDRGPRSANIVALESTRLAVMSPTAFREALYAHPEVMDAVLQHLVGLIRKYSQRVVELSTLCVEDRIRLELVRLACEHANGGNSARISPAPTLAEIASRVSTTREAVSREIARLSRDRIVERDGEALQVLDLGRLNEMVEVLVDH